MKYKPTEEQKPIIDCEDRFISVQAGPGTGKTFTLCRKIETLLQNNKLASTEKILFCTYTNALTSNNLQSLSKNTRINTSKVRTSTLDSFLYDLLRKLTLSTSDNKLLRCFESNNASYQQAASRANELFEEKKAELSILILLALKRYPYVYIDEIQDIKNLETHNGRTIQSPKYKLLERIHHSSEIKQLIIVGDDNQSLTDILSSNLRFGTQTAQVPTASTNKNLIFTPFKLTQSIRNCLFTGSTPENHSQILQKADRSMSIHQAINFLENAPCIQDIMIIMQNFSSFPDTMKAQLRSLPTFWLENTQRGQHALPQAVINSLLWYNQTKKGIIEQSLDSILLPFKRELKVGISFSYFKCQYYLQLQKDPIFPALMDWLILQTCDSQKPKVLLLESFYREHKHLDKFSIEQFQHKFLVSTINSAKGLEADIIYYFQNNPTRSQKRINHEFVANTRHKLELYLCTFSTSS